MIQTLSSEPVVGRYFLAWLAFGREERHSGRDHVLSGKVMKKNGGKDQSEGHSTLMNLLKNGNQIWRMIMTQNLRAVEKITLNARESSLVSSFKLKAYPKPRDQTFQGSARKYRK
jgi:hypothetical protein